MPNLNSNLEPLVPSWMQTGLDMAIELSFLLDRQPWAAADLTADAGSVPFLQPLTFEPLEAKAFPSTKFSSFLADPLTGLGSGGISTFASPVVGGLPDYVGTIGAPGEQDLYTFTDTDAQQLVFDGLIAPAGLSSRLADPSGVSLPLASSITTISGSLDAPGETDRYNFTLDSDRFVYFDSLTNNAGIRWTLDGPRGAVVTNRPLSQSDSFESLDGAQVMALVAGDYRLSVDGNADATGTYAFRLLDPTDAQPLVPGAPVTTTLDPANSTTVFSFAASRGDRFFFDAQSVTQGGGSWRLYDPLGHQTWSANFETDVDVREMAVSGTYLLLLEGRVFQGGTNTIRFNVQPVVDDTVAISLGERVDGEIAHAGQVDRFTFTLTEPTRVVFDSLVSSELTWAMSGPLGTVNSRRNFRNADGVELGTTNPVMNLVAGDYTVAVDPAGDTTGSYAFRVLNLASAEAIAPGTMSRLARRSRQRFG